MSANIIRILEDFKARNEASEQAAKQTEEDEAKRRRLNSERLTAELVAIVRPKLLEARQAIVAKGFTAEVETKTSTDGKTTFSVVLKTHPIAVAEASFYKLDYTADDHRAVITAQIRLPSPCQKPFAPLGLFPIDTLTPELVDGHLEQLLKLAFQ